MTHEEVLARFKTFGNFCDDNDGWCDCDCEKCGDMERRMIEAIEKQIPRKPRYEDGDYYCKECGAKLETYLYSRCVSYCSSCGSAHDWNDCK